MVWSRSRDHQQSATIADLFEVAGLDHDPALLTAYREFWEPHTHTDPAVRPLFERLRAARPRLVQAIEAIAGAIPSDYAARELIPAAEVAAVLARQTA